MTTKAPSIETLAAALRSVLDEMKAAGYPDIEERLLGKWRLNKTGHVFTVHAFQGDNAVVRERCGWALPPAAYPIYIYRVIPLDLLAEALHKGLLTYLGRV